MGTPPLPWQPVPMPDHSFSKEILPNIQSEPPLMQLEAVASRPIAGYLGELFNPFTINSQLKAFLPLV